MHAVTEALAKPPNASGTAIGSQDSDGDGDAAAPFLNMMTHATEDTEDTIESIGRITGVTVPRAQTLVTAALGVYQQQEEAIQELQNMLYDLGVPLPPLSKRRHTENTVEQQSSGVFGSHGRVSIAVDPETETVDDTRPSQVEEQEHTHISVDTNTGRVSVVRRHSSLMAASGEDSYDNFDGGEPTLLSVPLGQQPAKQKEEDKQQNQTKSDDNGDEDRKGKKEDDSGQFVAPFASMEEVMAKVPSFLISTKLDDINAGVAALNKAYAAQSESGKACQLTNEEAYSVLADERLFPYIHIISYTL